MRKHKRFFASLCAFVTALAVMPTVPQLPMHTVRTAAETTAEETPTSGTFGSDLTWSFDTMTGTLTIMGKGSMPSEYSMTYHTPWYDLREEITKVILPDGVTDIGTRAFYGCTNLTEINIPDTVTKIGNESFYKCSRLPAVNIPETVTSIGSDVFYGCQQLTEIAIPEGVSVIGESIFAYCDNLTTVTLPDSLTWIRNKAFYVCKALTNISIPNAVTTIGAEAFAGCTSLDALVIPESVTTIGGEAFKKTAWLDARIAENPVVVVNNILIDGTSAEGKVIIPDGVTCIASYAFYDSQNLTDIVIPDSVTKIEDHVFYRCQNLTDIVLPPNLTALGSYTFDECTGLTEIIIPDSVTTINGGTFHGCTGLTEITLPESLEELGPLTFYECTALTAVTILNPYCKIYDTNDTIPAKATIYGYSNSTARNYAKRYRIPFVELEGAPSEVYTYEVIPLLAPFNEYFFVRTNNPDPDSFRFADADSVYSVNAEITRSRKVFADVLYDDPETLRVGGGYIFYSGNTDGGAISLQILNFHGTWEDLGEGFTLPALCDVPDYLIQTYATKSSFFDNMDAVQSGFSSICLYSGSYVRGEVFRSADHWRMATSPHIDQVFYLYSPYSRRGNVDLFATAVYPFRYDSLGFPGIMGRVSKRLSSKSSYVGSSTAHDLIEVTYDGETRTYGGQGNGKGQGISKNQLTRYYAFDEPDTEVTLEDTLQLLREYAQVEMSDDIPHEEDEVTWSLICDTVGDGAWARFGGSFSFLYRANDANSFSTSDAGVGSSLYWWGSLGYASDAWVDGRYVNSYERFVLGATFEEHPDSDIILTDVIVPEVEYEYERVYNPETKSYELQYVITELAEHPRTVRYRYDSQNEIWYASNIARSGMSYNMLCNLMEKGALDEKYLDALQLTHDEVMALNIDRNTNLIPESGYCYDGDCEPGTPFRYESGNIDFDHALSVADAVLLQKYLLTSEELIPPQWEIADMNRDGSVNAADLTLLKRQLLDG